MPVLGPEEPAISRIRNEYIRIIIIKTHSTSVVEQKNYSKNVE
jgi:primosomal protein N' (replication factor Y)